MVTGLPQTYRLMTYNIGGGRKDFGSELDLIKEIIRDVQPDILALQEVIQIQHYDKSWSTSLEIIVDNIGYKTFSFYSPSLTLREHLCPRKNIMVHSLFRDHLDWQQGNAIVSRWPFHQLGNKQTPGSPRTVPLFRPKVYEGNRDTEPRDAVICRIGQAPFFPIVVGLHFTTLINERGKKEVPEKREKAIAMREQQATHVINLLKTNALEKGETVFILGDFNATIDEPTISSILVSQGGFLRIPLEHGQVSTHPKARDAIDHILVFPKDRVIEYRGIAIDSNKAKQASDHLPIIADITISD